MPNLSTQGVEKAFALGVGGPGSQMLKNVSALAAASQATGTKILSEGIKVDVSVSTGSLVLPVIGSGEAGGPILIINDTANSINLYPGLGETINALGANAAIAIPANNSAFVIPVGTPFGIGGVATASGLNWKTFIGG